MKLPEFQRNERLIHILFASQFSRNLLEHLWTVATKIRAIAKTKDGALFLQGLLPHKRAMLYFTQASTRTFLSFTAAAQILGMKCSEIRDPSVSSEYKGESPLDSMRMFSSYSDIIIMRSVIPNFAEACAYLMNDLDTFHQRSVPVVNAGSGADEHPTQALLDIHTIRQAMSFDGTSEYGRRAPTLTNLRSRYPMLQRGLGGKIYGFCGDLGRGRTVRSLAQMLSLYENVTMYFISPDEPKLRVTPDFVSRLETSGVRVLTANRLEECIDHLDVLYMTRIQREHDSSHEGARLPRFTPGCTLTMDLLSRMKEYAAVLHPFPRNEEIPSDIDGDPRAVYFEQAVNGMWARAALLAYLFDVDSTLSSHYERVFNEFHDYNRSAI
jgi:aspartate carbamoyltransferase